MATMNSAPPPRRPTRHNGGVEVDHSRWNQLADIAQIVAIRAADLLDSGLERDDLVFETKSSATDMVSQMDRMTEQLIVDHLLAVRPADGILGEEGGEHHGQSNVRWVIDPLDGTTNYRYRHPGYSVSIAAEESGRVVAGVIIDATSRECFRAVLGEGATRDGLPIHASNETVLAHALVATGFNYDPQLRAHQARVLAKVMSDIRDIRRSGSAALDLCAVACGRVDAFYELGLAPWDFAAGSLIASEAGAEVTDLSGDDLSTTLTDSKRVVFAAAPEIAAPLRSLLHAASADETNHLSA